MQQRLICIQNIQTYANTGSKSLTAARRTIDAIDSKKSRIISLVLEVEKNGNLFLIEGFQYFFAMNRVNRNKRIPCQIHPSKGEKNRLLHILKISLPLEKGLNSQFFYKHINILMKKYQLSTQEIADYTNNPKEKIENYIPSPSIPSHIQKKASKVNAITTVRRINNCKNILPNIKNILYEKAILEKSSSFRLTGNLLDKFIEMCQYNPFLRKPIEDNQKLEDFINELIFHNFYLSEHYRSLTPNKKIIIIFPPKRNGQSLK